MNIFRYEFIGYEAYQEILPVLQEKLCNALQDDEYHFVLAVNEAVCNAARYAIKGPSEAEIKIKLQITESDVTVTVRSATVLFDVIRYRERLESLSNNPEISKMEWGDYTGDTDRSRGFWYMLAACDYLYMAEDGQQITLCARAPYDSKKFTTKISDLVPRFYIEKNGVIL